MSTRALNTLDESEKLADNIDLKMPEKHAPSAKRMSGECLSSTSTGCKITISETQEQ